MAAVQQGFPGNGASGPRRFGLTELAVRYRTAVFVLVGLIVVAGLMAYVSVPKESAPEVEVPTIIVATPYLGVSPGDIETLVTRPIETALKAIPGVKQITSKSREGYSQVTVEFVAGTNMEEALQKVREKVALAKTKLPADADEPVIQEIDFSQFPILQVNISGDYSLVVLKKIADDLKERFEQVPQVLEVTVSGGLDREVQVYASLNRLKYYNLTFTDLVNAIRAENLTIPGGNIDFESRRFAVRVPGEFRDPLEVQDLVVKTVNGRPVYVRDVAVVDFGFRERSSYARLNGQPVVTLSVKKRSGENIIATAEQIKAILAQVKPSLPPGVRIDITGDQSKTIAVMVHDLQNHIIAGLILVVAVLLFFMGVRNAVLVGVAIPITMLLTFIVIWALGYTMNMIVLFSLVLALGILVDDAIVVVENIYRYVEEGYDRVTAARLATAEVAVPVITATLTILAAFFPLLFWPGIVGEFMKYLPITVIIALTCSLFVALVINPAIAATFMRREGERGPGLHRNAKILLALGMGLFGLLALLVSWVTFLVLVVGSVLAWAAGRWLLKPAIRWLMHQGMPLLSARYESLLRWGLRHRMLVLGGTFGIWVLTFLLFALLNAGVEFFPNTPPRTVAVNLEFPPGTTLDRTDEAVRTAEQVVSRLPGREDAESIVAISGGAADPFGFSAGGSGGLNKGSVTLNLIDYHKRQHDAFQTLRQIRQVVPEAIAGADVSVVRNNIGPPTGLPINIEIIGDDFQVLKRLSDQVLETLKRSPVYAKLDGLKSDMNDVRPELVVHIDRERAALYGVNTQMIASTIRSAINGVEAGKYRDGEDEYPITVRLSPEDRLSPEVLANLVVLKEGRQIPLSAVARWELTEGLGTVNRKDLNRVATVSANVKDEYNANAVLGEVRALLEGFELPPGYTMRFTGQRQEQEEASRFLGRAFLIGLLLILLIMVAEFNSVVKPLIIATSVLLSIIGVLWGLILFRMPFSIIMTGLGIISLAGIAVRNGIVLVDYADLLRARGMPLEEAVVRAGRTRLRPVLLTASTAILGLVPLTAGMNIDFLGLVTRLEPDFFWGGEQSAWWGPMGVAVIVGLTVATFLTLVVVPVMYVMVERGRAWFRRTFTLADSVPVAELPVASAEVESRPA
ncbi:MAG: efflux RND transporter permease subunit [Bacteroidetes bacterium]|nr:efflux RND transporter permease subunit [Rhodothermia bacterium]MCS7154716.1 efflux RND transporter permease subunit [Bacteroidota bacterium]MCX7907127.1 efflux RND transporter permease subunit [Bacteroidota bacterium]MDW8137509.1 efflux RND transporter permease subunit [Bacteroidota bacterium]MDW8285537.1 efflux RND transporter permease subunit [Bacteroidota bacterium]